MFSSKLSRVCTWCTHWGLMLHSVISSLLVGKLVWVPVISLCKIFIPSYVCDALLWPLIAQLCDNSSIQGRKKGDETDFLHLNWSSLEFQPQFKICLIHILPLNRGHAKNELLQRLRTDT